jgi:ubiquinone/menaquinone biosynthesis C-methylase UbiE
MVGVKLGDRLLVVGCGDPLLLAQLAIKTGLTGRAFALDENPQTVAAAAETAVREGALLETATAPYDTIPLESESFDVVVLRDVLPYLTAARRDGCVSEAQRVLRPGGRCLVIDCGGRVRRPASGRSNPAAPDDTAEEGPVRVLLRSGFKAARVLAEREGLVFAEAIKPAHSNDSRSGIRD